MERIRKRSWLFTWNNPDETEMVFLERMKDAVRFIHFQKEIGASGTPHFQGYVQFSTQKTMSAVKKQFGINSIHLEWARGTAEENVHYCSKPVEGCECAHCATDPPPIRVSGPFFFGNMVSGQGQRSDIAEVVVALREGESIEESIDKHPGEWGKYRSNLTWIASTVVCNEKPYVCLLFGPSGTGKSYFVREQMKEVGFGVDSAPVPWFDGCFGRECLLMEEFAGKFSKVELTKLLIWLDEYACLLPFKGGFYQRKAKIIAITTNIHPWKWYDYEQTGRVMQYKALARRVSRVYEFTDYRTYNFFDGEEKEDWFRHVAIYNEVDSHGDVESSVVSSVF